VGSGSWSQLATSRPTKSAFGIAVVGLRIMLAKIAASAERGAGAAMLAPARKPTSGFTGSPECSRRNQARTHRGRDQTLPVFDHGEVSGEIEAFSGDARI
jgi:hypothetical protein